MQLGRPLAELGRTQSLVAVIAGQEALVRRIVAFRSSPRMVTALLRVSSDLGGLRRRRDQRARRLHRAGHAEPARRAGATGARRVGAEGRRANGATVDLVLSPGQRDPGEAGHQPPAGGSTARPSSSFAAEQAVNGFTVAVLRRAGWDPRPDVCHRGQQPAGRQAGQARDNHSGREILAIKLTQAHGAGRRQPAGGPLQRHPARASGSRPRSTAG